MPTIEGRITVRETERKRQTRIISHEVRLGHVRLDNDKEGYTKISAWVPRPSDLNHKPGIFLSLSNPSGRSFVRLNQGDLEVLIQQFTVWLDSLNQAVAHATQISESFRQLDRSIHKDYPLINYSIKDITVVKDSAPADARAP